MSAAPLRSVTVAEALDSATIPLRAAGIDTARLDAELLLAHVLGTDRARLHSEPERGLVAGEGRAFAQLVRRRREREPVAYLVGHKHFRRLELAVDERVLIPRPETELLVEAALEHLPPGARVIDVGTGSGAVALALKDERPDLRVTAGDLSAAALEVARANAQRLGLEVELVEADLVAPGDWDAVVCNPPYVRDGDGVDPEVLHEPAGAVRGGVDGLDVVRRLVAEARAPLLAFEIGEGQAASVRALLAGRRVEVRRDLAGIERVVVAWA